MLKLAFLILEQELKDIRQRQRKRTKDLRNSQTLQIDKDIEKLGNSVNMMKRWFRIVATDERNEEKANKIMTEIGRNQKSTGTFGKG